MSEKMDARGSGIAAGISSISHGLKLDRVTSDDFGVLVAAAVTSALFLARRFSLAPYMQKPRTKPSEKHPHEPSETARRCEL
jgi:hypothetical protein